MVIAEQKTRAAKPKGLIVAGLSGGSGKSVVAVGLTAAFAARGRRVAPFKKGPDYIDAGWMQVAAGTPCYNLDPYLMPVETIEKSFHEKAQSADLVIIEGNRGLYDGVDIEAPTTGSSETRWSARSTSSSRSSGTTWISRST